MKKLFAILSVIALAACADEPLPSEAGPNNVVQATALGGDVQTAVNTMRAVTARYHSLAAAMADDFVLLHPCEARGDEGPVGTVYVNFARLLDGAIDPALPDALIYEPASNGGVKLVGVEFAVVNSGQSAPTFLGNVFQREDEFGVFALHAWVWKTNPEGMFAETNPRVSCGA